LCFASITGCRYDSLNVGTKSYGNAPCAGTDADEDEVFTSTGGSVWAPTLVPLSGETGWTGYRPLAEIDLSA
jgi:hypothetical protein